MRDLVGLAVHDADRAYLEVQRGSGFARPSGQEERGRPKAAPGHGRNKTALAGITTTGFSALREEPR